MHNELAALGNGAYALALQILGNSADASDAVQDAMLTALAKPQGYDAQKGALKPWFYQVVRNRALDLVRQRRVHVSDEQLLADDQDTPEEQALIAERDQHLLQLLQKISVDHREILILGDYAGLNYAEISQVLSIPGGTVMSRLHRARLALRKVALLDKEAMETQNPGEQH